MANRAAPTAPQATFNWGDLDRLACPACHGRLRPEMERAVCVNCHRAYPILDGIPVLIAERAQTAK